VVHFAVVIDVQYLSLATSSSSAAAAAAAAFDCQSNCDQPLAWVVSRQLQDFVVLHRQLLKVNFFSLQSLCILYAEYYKNWSAFIESTVKLAVM